jgi:L,D-transpeptidase ErfK/SrfK
MTRTLSPFRVIGATAALSALAACSLVGGPWMGHNKPPPAPVAPPPPPAPVLPAPQETSRFELADSQNVIGDLQQTTVGKDDTLTDIARRFNLGYEELLRANPGVDPWLPGVGRSIVLPTRFVLPDAPHDGVVINIAAMRLYYFPPHKAGESQVVYTHPIGIGKVGWATPEGTTKIVRRQKDPSWHPPISVIKEHKENGDELPSVVGPGPDNPLGNRAFYLTWPGYLIHGTNKPAGVGLRSSHGCIRLFPEDIDELFDKVAIGTQVHVVNQPFVFGWDNGQLVMQSFGSLEDDRRDWKKAQQALLSKSLSKAVQKELQTRGETVDWELVLQLAHAPRGVIVPVTLTDASVDKVLANATKVENQLPDGASWDGKSDLPVDEKTFDQIMGDSDPQDHLVPTPATHKTGG